MGFLDRLFGRSSNPQQPNYNQTSGAQYGYNPSAQSAGQQRQPTEDQAVARYKYLLRTATPDQLEQVHAEAFAKLTPQQRQQLLQELSQSMPAGEQVRSDSPQDLARAATRAEMRQPGYLQNTFSRRSFGGGGIGMGGTIMGSMMGTIGGVIIGTAIADMLFDGFDSSPEASALGEGNFNDDAQLDTSNVDSGDSGSYDSGDAGGDSFGGFDSFDSGGDFGGFGDF